LGDVIGEFVEVAEPIFAVLPVGEADRGHSGSLSGGRGLSRGWLIVDDYDWPPRTYPRPSLPPRPAGMVIRLRGGNSRLRKVGSEWLVAGGG
jgi:hypothetical protein